MIRPFTCITALLAAASGLYLYQVKQNALVLDARITRTVHAADAARERTRFLHAEWALLNDPQRLQSLATQYLTLKPMGPAQLLTLRQLADRLPAPGTPPPASAMPAPGLPPDMPMAAASGPAPTLASATAAIPAGADPAALATAAPADATLVTDAPLPPPPPAAPAAPPPVRLAVAPVAPSFAPPAPRPAPAIRQAALPRPMPAPAPYRMPAARAPIGARVLSVAASEPRSTVAGPAPAIAPPFGSSSGSTLGMASANLAPPVPFSQVTGR